MTHDLISVSSTRGKMTTFTLIFQKLLSSTTDITKITNYHVIIIRMLLKHTNKVTYIPGTTKINTNLLLKCNLIYINFHYDKFTIYIRYFDKFYLIN